MAFAYRQTTPRSPEVEPRDAPRVTVPTVSLDGLMVVVIRHWKWVFATVLAFGIGVLMALPFLTSSYEVSASLLVKLGREQTPPPVAGTAQISATPYKRTEDVMSELEILSSPALIERVVKELGVDYFLAEPPPQTLLQKIKAQFKTVTRAVRDAWTEALIWIGLEKRLTPFERVVLTLQGSIRTESVKRSDVISVKMFAANPDAGVHVLKRLLELYQAEHIKVFKTPGSTEFLEARVAELREELAAIEAKRRSFGERDAVWDYQEQHKQLLVRRHDALQALTRTKELRSQLTSEITSSEQALAAQPAEKLTQRVEQVSPAVQSLQGRILERKAVLSTLRLNFATNSQRVRDEEAQIKELEALLARTQSSFVAQQTFEVSPARNDLERALTDRRTRLAGVNAMASRQAEALSEVEAEIERVAQLGEEARRLDREAASAEQSYRLFVQRLDEARIQEALDTAEISNVAMIGEPVASVKPVRPRAMLLFLVSLGAGLLASLGFFILRDALRPSVHSRDRVAQVLGVPVLVRLPEVRS